MEHYILGLTFKISIYSPVLTLKLAFIIFVNLIIEFNCGGLTVQNSFAHTTNQKNLIYMGQTWQFKMF